MNIFTVDYLHKGKIIVMDWCYMCVNVDHLLLHCEVSKTLWNAIFSLAWVMSRNVVELLACWKGKVWLPTECNVVEDDPGLFVALYMG